MKTTVTTKKVEEKTYPWVGVDPRAGHVVLFLGGNCGVTLVAGSTGFSPGEEDTFVEEFFTPCTITLSSEE